MPPSRNQVKWLPFILQPALPREGVDLRTHHRKQMGARADAMLDDLKAVGKCHVCVVLCVSCRARHDD